MGKFIGDTSGPTVSSYGVSLNSVSKNLMAMLGAEEGRQVRVR